ncbi:phenazine biosynthesis FMN-dependent oxidase PhzG [Streptomyces kanasensis]|uniref:phenazine biosynthesis FMN-dependent oxidase PhzG n=1 Tax=Streptomyces kanasensis TaxID=936756 RepID=UPI0036FEFCD7
MNSTRSESLTGTVELPFPEYVAPPPDPLALLGGWLEEAEGHRVREPRALALATADVRGRTSSRIVVLNRLTRTGLVFATHLGSRKGRELESNPWASGVLYWRETSRQVVVAGPVERLPEAETEALWTARPPFTHAMSTASRQSEPLNGLQDVSELRERAGLLAGAGRPLPRPPAFVAYELRPVEVEFWANGHDRLHERLRYDRSGPGWAVSRLQP